MGPHLSPIRALLNNLEGSDPDDVTRYHARVALAEMDAIVRRLFGAVPT